MNITPEILIYLFSQKHHVLYQHLKRHNQTFQGVRLYDPKETPDKNFIYVLSEAAFRRLSSADRKRFSMVFVAASAKNDAEKPASFTAKDLSITVFAGFPNPGSLYYALQQQYQTMLQQQNELLLFTMDPEQEEEVFAYGKNWFPWEYSIVDIDMRLLYHTDRLQEVTGSEENDRVPAESILDLILNREFHEAAKRDDVFYQSMTFNNRIAVARNILIDGKYAGRVVMFLSESQTAVPEGASMLFRFFTDCVRETLRRSGHFTGRTQNDPTHQLCRSLFRGETVPTHAVNDGLNNSGWKNSHSYFVVVFRFLADSAWGAQLETTLPYLADELELEWPNSCAVITDREIDWVLNLSLSKISNQSSFHQQITGFVRDHICIAGSSPAFQDIKYLSDAKKSAAAALELGQQRHPHFWYFSFDNYRLDYIRNLLQSELQPDFLCHPEVRKLREYDRKNHTELSETLRSFLNNGRNMTAAADAIFVHRTTFCRRMDQIKKMTGLDLNDPDTALLLELSYQLDS